MQSMLGSCMSETEYEKSKYYFLQRESRTSRRFKCSARNRRNCRGREGGGTGCPNKHGNSVTN